MVDATGLVFVLVPAGPVKPGGTQIVPAAFISKYEMTRAQWERLAGWDPSHFKGSSRTWPVEQVSRYHCEQQLPRWGLA